MIAGHHSNSTLYRILATLVGVRTGKFSAAATAATPSTAASIDRLSPHRVSLQTPQARSNFLHSLAFLDF